MKVPQCKLCGKAHWTYEEHDTGEVPEYVKEMVAGVVTTTQSYEPSVTANIRTEMNNRTNKRTRGRPRKWSSEAERLRAYREHQGGLK